MKKTIFTLTSARSGTLYLRSLFQNNVPDCVCRHEPFFDWGNPTMFGRAIDDATSGRWDRIRVLLAKKRDYIERLPGSVYLESSHAFLKSAYVAALEFFPEMRLVHLIRDPLKVAKSEAFREYWRRLLRAPFHCYAGEDRRRYFVWALTGKEPIFQSFDLDRLSLFQRCLIQWIEIENRAATFLEKHGLHHRCFTLHSPEDLNDVKRVRAMFDRLGVQTFGSEIIFGGRKNRSFGRRATVITPKDERESEEVLSQLPAQYLSIFQREPYVDCSWASRLKRTEFTGLLA
jgi:hypothetical protein